MEGKEGDHPPEVTPEQLEQLDMAADRKEVERLLDMGVMRAPRPGENLEEYGFLTTKVVRDWRKRPNWLRRSRLVAREFRSWEPWQAELFAPSSNLAVIHALMAVALTEDLELVTLDVKDAYLNVRQRNPVVIKVDERLVGGSTRRMVPYVLEYLLPGQRAAASEWFDFMVNLLGEAGLTGFPKEPTLFRGEGPDLTKMVLHADDGILAATRERREALVSQVGKRVEVQVSEPLSISQGIEFLKRRYYLDSHGIIMYPSTKYLDSLLAAVGSVRGREAPTDNAFLEPDTSEALNENEARVYRECTGRLLYLSHTRCDIQFGVCILAGKMAQPTKQALKNLKRVIGYLKNVPEIGFRIKPLNADACVDYEGRALAQQGDKIILESVTDSDWAGHRGDRRSRSSVQIYFGGSLMASYVRTQKNISLSSGESEFVAMVGGAGEAIYLKDCIDYMTKGVYLLDTVLRTDSAAARGIGQRIGAGRVRHLDCGLLWVQKGIKEKWFRAAPIGGARNPSDLGTKPLSASKIREHLCRAGAVTEDGNPYGQGDLDEAEYKATVRRIAKSGGLTGTTVKKIVPVLLLMTQLVSADGHVFEGLSVAMAAVMAEDTIAELVGTITGILFALIIMMSLPVGIGILIKIVLQRIFKRERPKQFVEAGVQTIERWRQEDRVWADEYTKRSHELQVALSEKCREQEQCSAALRELRGNLRASEAEILRLRAHVAHQGPIAVAMSRGHVYHKPNCGALRSSNSVKTFQPCNLCCRGEF